MKQKLFTPAFIILFIENFLFFASHGSLNTFPAHLSDIGASRAYIGFFMNVNPLMLVLSVLFFSSLIRKIPWKSQLFIGFFLQIVSFSLSFFISDNVIILMILRFLSAFSYYAGFTVNVLMAFSIIPPKQRAGGIALFGISGVLSNPATSFLGEKIIQYNNPKYLFLLGIGFTVLAIIMTSQIRIKQEKTHSCPLCFWDILQRKRLWGLMFIMFAVGGSWSTLTTFIPNLSQERFGVVYLSYYFFAFSIIAILSRFFFMGFIDLIPLKKILLFALFIAFSSMIMTRFVYHPWQFYLVGLLYGTAHSILYPVVNAAFVSSGSRSEQTILSNTCIVFYTAGNILNTTLFGWAGDLFGTGTIFICMAGFIAICIAVTYKININRVKVIENPETCP